LAIPLDTIEAVLTSWGPGGHQAPGTRNLVPIAHPNRMILLRGPMAGRRGPVTRVAFRVDDPAAFDRAMAEARVAVRSGG
jgi:hypothetical protein